VAKKLTYIQQLEAKKRKYHKAKHKKKYPNGVFSIQIRYGDHGWSHKAPGIENRIQLRWGIKRNTQCYGTSFAVVKTKDGVAFDYTYNYNNLNSLLRKCEREGVDPKLVNAYLEELKKRGIQAKQKGEKG